MSDMGIQPLEPTSTVRFKNGPEAECVHYHVFYEGLTDEYRLLAEQTLGETDINKENGLKKLKEYMKTYNLDKYSVEDVEPVFICFISYLLTFPMTSICGLSYIAESHCESTFLMYCLFKRYKSYVDFMLTAPLRMGRVDLLHEPFVAHLFYNTLRPILPRKLTERIFFNGSSYTVLHSAHPVDLLPKEFDGNMEPINCKHYKESLMKFIQMMKEEKPN